MPSLYTRIVEQALPAAERKAKAFCRSTTLKRFMSSFVKSDTGTKTTGRVRVPHYWAKYLHDGRDAIVGKWMVFFRNPNRDPRLFAGRPVARGQEKKLNLSKEEFWRLRKSGELIAKRAVRSSRPKANPFFSNTGGMAGLDKDVSDIAQRETYRYMEEELKRRGLKKKTITRVI